jgi:hypothetical protein
MLYYTRSLSGCQRSDPPGKSRAQTIRNAAALEDGQARQLTGAGTSNTHPCWSPDGQQIAFISNRNGRPQIYLIGPALGGLLGGAVIIEQVLRGSPEAAPARDRYRVSERGLWARSPTQSGRASLSPGDGVLC